MPTRKNQILFAFVTFIGMLLVIFALGESMVRLKYSHIEEITGMVEWKETSPVKGKSQHTYYWDDYHPEYGWTNLKGYKSGHAMPLAVTINNQGLRGGTEYPAKAAAGKKRIVVFGDSTTFGNEVNDDETVPFFLERILGDTEVLNFGVHSYGLGQMYLRLKNEGFQFHPDRVIVVLFLPWDIYRDIKSFTIHNKPIFSAKDSQLAIKNIPVPLKSRFSWLYHNSYLYSWLYGLITDTINREGKVGESIEASLLILREIKKECDERNTPFTLVNIIAAANTGSDTTMKIVDFINASYQNIDIDRLNLTEELTGFFKREGRAVVAEKGHWSARGNCFIAERIAEHLGHSREGRKETCR